MISSIKKLINSILFCFLIVTTACCSNLLFAKKDQIKSIKHTTQIKKNNKTIERTDKYIYPGQNYKPRPINAKNEYLEIQFYDKFKEALISDITNTDKTAKKVIKNAKISIDNTNKVFIENCLDTLFINKRISRLKYTYKKGLDLLRLNKINNAASLTLLAYLAAENNDKHNSLKLLKLADSASKNKINFSKSLFLKFVKSATNARIYFDNHKLQKIAVTDFYKYSDSKQPNLLNVRTGLQIIKKSSIGAKFKKKWMFFYDGITINSSHWIANMVSGHYNLYRATLAEKGKISGKTKKESSDAYYLALAGNNFKKAIEIYRTAPEAFTQMIYISSSGSMTHRNNPRLYFDQAIMASFDYQDAYKSMLLAALKSTILMRVILFGDECLKTKRFDTVVPLFYPSALALAGYYMPANNWQRPFFLNSTKQKLYYLVKKLRENNNKNQYSKDELETLELLFYYWCGDYYKALQLLENNPNLPQYNKKLRIPFVAGKKFFELSRDQFYDFLLLYTGKNGKELITIDKLLTRNKFKEGILKLEKLLQKTTNINNKIILVKKLIFTKNNYSANRISLEKRDLLEFVVDKGGVIELKSLLNILFSPKKQKQNIYAKITNNKRSPIVAAIESHQLDCLKMLLKYYTPINMKGYTHNALYYAIESNNLKAVNLLIKNKEIKSFINKPFNNIELTPLSYAILKNRKKIINLLIEQPTIDINKQSGIGKDTPLHIAATLGNFPVVMKLISKQAKKDIKNSANLTASETAKTKEISNFIDKYEYKTTKKKLKK